MNKMRRAVTALGATMLIGLTGWVTPASAQYFKGKTIEVIVGFSSGGTDTAARIVARRLGKYIPGNPNVVIKNMPGAGSLTAQNYVFERAKPDGLTIGFNPLQVMTQVTGHEAVRFNYPDFTYIAGVKGPSFVTVVRKDIAPGGINEPADILKIDTPLSYAGRNALHSIDVLSSAAFDVLGMEHTYVPGFRGSAEITTSMEQKETNITGAGSVHFVAHLTPRLVETGQAVPLFQFGLFDENGDIVPDVTYAGVPLFRDFYEEVYGEPPSGEMYDAFVFAEKLHGLANWLLAGPPGMDPEVAEILRKATQEAMADPETIAETLKIEDQPFQFVGADRGAEAMEELRNADPEVVAFWKERAARMTQ